MFQNANQVILKVTKGCNLRCKYCYVVDKDKYENDYMSFDTFKKVVDKIIFDKSKSSNDRSIDITFHGGEPTKLDKKTFYNMCEYAQYKMSIYNIGVKFSIQTNLTLIDEEWCNIFSKFNISVGFSFDGINDSNSMRNSLGEDFYKEKIDLLNKFKIKNGCLLVANNKNIENIDESLSYVKDVFHRSNCKINYSEDVVCDFDEESDIEVSSNKYYEKHFVKQINDYIKTGSCFSSDVLVLIEKFIVNYLSMSRSFSPDYGNCYIKYCGSGVKVLEVNPDGSITMCGRFGEEYDEVTFRDYNDFLNANQTKKLLEFHKNKIKYMRKIGCDSCIASSICDHGCMAFYFTKSKNNNKTEWGIRDDLVCGIFKPLYNFLLQNSEEIINAYFITHSELVLSGEVYSNRIKNLSFSKQGDQTILRKVSNVI